MPGDLQEEREKLFQQGVLHEQNKEWWEAYDTYLGLIRRAEVTNTLDDPFTFKVRFHFVPVLLNVQMYDKAIAQTTLLIQNQFRLLGNHLYRATAYEKIEHFAEAYRDYRTVLTRLKYFKKIAIEEDINLNRCKAFAHLGCYNYLTRKGLPLEANEHFNAARIADAGLVQQAIKERNEREGKTALEDAEYTTIEAIEPNETARVGELPRL